jgi:WbqC-like protein family
LTSVVVSQPQLFPWAGFFELIASADIYVHLDDAQFSKGSFTNRIQIKHPNGRKWMTVPLKGKGQFQAINQVEAVGDDWKRQHRELVQQSLSGAPFLKFALDLFDRVYERALLIDLLIASVETPAATIGLGKPSQWLKSSSLGVEGASWKRVLSIVRAVGGARYITAHGAANYLDHEAFEDNGVTVEYLDYSKTVYPQLHGEFSPYVSILDLVANLGPDARNVIRPRTISWREFLVRQTGA